MIHFDRLSYTYPSAAHPALLDVTLDIAAGEFVLLTGPSGAGKSTLLRLLNGLVPHMSGGVVRGGLTVAGHDPLSEGPQVLSCVVGLVLQDPEAQFVVDRVEDEVAFALENQAVPPVEMRRRVAEALERLELTALRARRLETLSGGEQQRVAIAAALVLQPRVLALDEPTSQLAPQSAEQVLQALVRLNRELGLTVVLSEHRLERILPHADRLIHLPAPGAAITSGPPRQVLPQMELTPPLVTLGKALGWEPLPLTVDEGQRIVKTEWTEMIRPPSSALRPSIFAIHQLHFSYHSTEILRGIDLEIGAGELLALLGRNGAGKTTLLRCIVGLLHPQQGTMVLEDESLVGQSTTAICRRVGYLPQAPDDLLFADTVTEEMQVTLRNHGLQDNPPISPAMLLERLGLSGLAEAYPRELSVGQRQRVALGTVTVTRPRLLLLDEPTRGMDYAAKRELQRLLAEWQREGTAVLLVTHDVEWAAEAAGRVAVLEEGRISRVGTPAEVLAAPSPFTPQIARLFPGRGWLTVQDVLSAVEPSPAVTRTPSDG